MRVARDWSREPLVCYWPVRSAWLVRCFVAVQGITAATPGTYAIDTFKVMLRHQNTHALVNAGFVWGLSGSTVTSARVVYGAVGKELFRAVRTEAALIGNELNQATHDAAQAALAADIEAGEWQRRL